MYWKGITYYQAKIITRDLCDGALWVSTLMSSISSLETTKWSFLVFQTRFNLHFVFSLCSQTRFNLYFSLHPSVHSNQSLSSRHSQMPTLCTLPQGIAHITTKRSSHGSLRWWWCPWGKYTDIFHFFLGGGNLFCTMHLCPFCGHLNCFEEAFFFCCCPHMNFKNFLGLLLFISTLWIWRLTDLVLLMESVQEHDDSWTPPEYWTRQPEALSFLCFFKHHWSLLEDVLT